jgi:hypothetical protein
MFTMAQKQIKKLKAIQASTQEGTRQGQSVSQHLYPTHSIPLPAHPVPVPTPDSFSYGTADTVELKQEIVSALRRVEDLRIALSLAPSGNVLSPISVQHPSPGLSLAPAPGPHCASASGPALVPTSKELNKHDMKKYCMLLWITMGLWTAYYLLPLELFLALITLTSYTIMYVMGSIEALCAYGVQIAAAVRATYRSMSVEKGFNKGWGQGTTHSRNYNPMRNDSRSDHNLESCNEDRGGVDPNTNTREQWVMSNSFPPNFRSPTPHTLRRIEVVE